MTKNILYKPNQHSDKKWLLLNDSLTNGQRRKWRCFRSNCLQTLRKRPHRKFQCQGLKRPQPLVFFCSYVMQKLCFKKGFAIWNFQTRLRKRLKHNCTTNSRKFFSKRHFYELGNKRLFLKNWSFISSSDVFFRRHFIEPIKSIIKMVVRSKNRNKSAVLY